jgi:hypothetical protein
MFVTLLIKRLKPNEGVQKVHKVVLERPRLEGTSGTMRPTLGPPPCIVVVLLCESRRQYARQWSYGMVWDVFVMRLREIQS